MYLHPTPDRVLRAMVDLSRPAEDLNQCGDYLHNSPKSEASDSGCQESRAKNQESRIKSHPCFLIPTSDFRLQASDFSLPTSDIVIHRSQPPAAKHPGGENEQPYQPGTNYHTFKYACEPAIVQCSISEQHA